jgi:hypothetical protein
MPPSNFSTKTPNTVQAMFFGGDDQQMQAARDWVASLVDETAIVDYSSFMRVLYVKTDTLELNVENNSYIYLDADGLHTASKGAFEMAYVQDA